MDASIGSERTMGGGGGGGVYALREGDTLGPYRVIRPLGRGGMGEVYLATHPHLGTRVALKIIRPELATDPGFIDRFRHEARLMARLRHPNIVLCRDAGIDRDMPWLAMDYIEGPRGEPMDLHGLLAERRQGGKLFEEDEAIAVGLQICEALAYAHSYRDEEIPSGILHRDLKPGNILVGADTRLYVSDFGLARMIGQGFEKSLIEQSLSSGRSMGDLRTVGAAPRAATSSDRVGTFDYMSPEQREGKEVDARSDVFALGAILYELLTGRKVAGVPKRPTKVRPGLRPVWDEIIYERCLAAEPADRYGSAAELKDIILRFTAREQAKVTWEEAPRPPREDARPSTTIAIPVSRIVIVALLLAIAIGAGVWSSKRSKGSTKTEPVRSAVPVDKATLAPTLVVRLGAIRVLGSVPPRAEAHFQSVEKQVRIGSRPWRAMREMPHVEMDLPCEPVEVEMSASGYHAEAGLRSTATVADRQTTDVTFVLSPLPAKLRVTCEAPDAIVQVETNGPSVRLTGAPVEVPALMPVTLTVSAPSHVPQTRTLGAMNPDETYTNNIMLEKKPPCAQLRLMGVSTEPFELLFLSRLKLSESDIRFQINNRKNQLVHFKKIGDQIDGYVVEAYDIATDRLVLRGRGEVKRLPRGRAVPSNVLIVRFKFLPEGREFDVRLGEIFAVQGQDVRLLGVTADGSRARIRAEADKKEYWCSSTSADLIAAPAAETMGAYPPGHLAALSAIPGTGPIEDRDWTSPETGMEFVWIPALKIWVGKYEATNADYRKKVPDHDSQNSLGKSLNGDRQPVVAVNFEDAKAFADWMTQRDRAAGALPADCRYRLPSEQEWHAFAQCGDNREYPWGNGMPPKYGNYADQSSDVGGKIDGYDDGFPVTCPVERSGKNDWGLYGVGGNVWEIAASDVSSGAFGAVRGASWGSFVPGELRCAFGAKYRSRAKGGSKAPFFD